jgi:hypothetical protein
MKIISNCAVIFLALCLTACSAKYQVNKFSGTDGNVALDAKEAVFITIPADGAYGNTLYQGSGQTVAQAVAIAFSKSAKRVYTAAKPLSREEAIAESKRLNAMYVVLPTIVHWEHRATEWSGRPSRMSIRLSVVDSSEGSELTSAAIEGRSRIMTMTSTSPESLLRDPLAGYVAGLYR